MTPHDVIKDTLEESRHDITQHEEPLHDSMRSRNTRNKLTSHSKTSLPSNGPTLHGQGSRLNLLRKGHEFHPVAQDFHTACSSSSLLRSCMGSATTYDLAKPTHKYSELSLTPYVPSQHQESTAPRLREPPLLF